MSIEITLINNQITTQSAATRNLLDVSDGLKIWETNYSSNQSENFQQPLLDQVHAIWHSVIAYSSVWGYVDSTNIYSSWESNASDSHKNLKGVAITRSNLAEYSPDSLLIEWFAIDPNQKTAGDTRANQRILLDRIETDAKENKFRQIVIDPNNEILRLFFEAHGYKSLNEGNLKKNFQEDESVEDPLAPIDPDDDLSSVVSTEEPSSGVGTLNLEDRSSEEELSE